MIITRSPFVQQCLVYAWVSCMYCTHISLHDFKYCYFKLFLWFSFLTLCSILASIVCLRTIVIVEQLGIKRLTSAFSMIAFFQGIAFILNPPAAGKHFHKSISGFKFRNIVWFKTLFYNLQSLKYFCQQVCFTTLQNPTYIRSFCPEVCIWFRPLSALWYCSKTVFHQRTHKQTIYLLW